MAVDLSLMDKLAWFSSLFLVRVWGGGPPIRMNYKFLVQLGTKKKKKGLLCKGRHCLSPNQLCELLFLFRKI